jgi:hypothetical protein
LLLSPALFAEGNPGYLHALSDLRAARWLIDHVPGDWARVVDEQNAVKKIDDAINEIKNAAIFDGKNINDHPPVDETLDHPGRLRAALELLHKARNDLNGEPDIGSILGLKGRAWEHIDQAMRFTESAIRAVPVAVQGQHPEYLHALADLRTARWLIANVPGDWARVVDEQNAIRTIDDSINEIRIASIDDGKDVNWHPVVQVNMDHGGRLHDALALLFAARNDLAQAENNGAVLGLRDRAWVHIDQAIGFTQRAIQAVGPSPAMAPAPQPAPVVVQQAPQGQHPAYLHALSDLRTARWLIANVPGDWARVIDEQNAIRTIDDSINEIRIASIDDGKDVNWNPVVQMNMDHGGRLRDALALLFAARNDLAQAENNGAVLGLRDRAWVHIDQAIGFTQSAIQAVGPSQAMAPAPQPAPVVVQQAPQGQHPEYLHALSDLRTARWLIANAPGNWARVVDEQNAIRTIDDAINEIRLASIDDGKDVNWRPAVQVNMDHGGRLHDALALLNASRNDLAQAENNGAVLGLRDRAWVHIDQAIRFTLNAIQAVGPGQAAPAPQPAVVVVQPVPPGKHPEYLHSLSDLRAARWLIDHVPGDWARAQEEILAVQKIDDAINEIKRAAIDDGKDVGWHPAVQERKDHGGRLHDALDLLRRARADIAKAENNAAVLALRDRAWVHIDEAIRDIERAIQDKGW